jgi:hypothetical protein
MTFAITRQELQAAFGADRLVTVPADRLNPVVTHESSRTFLAEVGLLNAGIRFQAAAELADGGITGQESVSGIVEDLTDPRAGRLLLLGGFGTDWVFLDGADGTVWVADDGNDSFDFLNSRIDLFVRFTAALARDWAHLSVDEPDDDRREAAGDNLVVELRALDPQAFAAPDGYWYRTIDNVATGY